MSRCWGLFERFGVDLLVGQPEADVGPDGVIHKVDILRNVPNISLPSGPRLGIDGNTIDEQ